MKSQMKAADRSGAAVAVIIGSDELETGTAVIRPLRAETRDQTIVSIDDLIDSIRKHL
jgi:histidyl-tRNA synthetase